MKRLLLVFLAAALLAGCSRSPYAIDKAAHDAEILAWQKKRLERLTTESGWLTLCGLFWLKEGANLVGADTTGAVVLPAGTAPAKVGVLTLDRGAVTLSVLPGVTVTIGDSAVSVAPMITDADPTADATIATVGRLTMQVIKRGDGYAVRVKNKDNPARIHFAGLEYFPVDLAWRVVAKFEPYNPPRTLKSPTVINTIQEDSLPGALVFEIGGKQCRLDAVIEQGSEGQLFLMFGDATNGHETYAVGRQLYTSLPDSAGNVVIDFNKAYNWPCVFTPYATCPIPPRQNLLPVRVEAGEKMYSGHQE